MATVSDMKATVPTLGDDPNVPRDILNAVNSVSAYTGQPPFATTAARDAAYTNAGIALTVGMRCSVAGVPQKYVSTGWINCGVRQVVESNSLSGFTRSPGGQTLLSQPTIPDVLAGSMVEVEFTLVLSFAAASAGVTSIGGYASLVLTGPGGVEGMSRTVRWHNQESNQHLYPASGRITTRAVTPGTWTASIYISVDPASGAGVKVFEMPIVLREIVT